MLNYLKGKFYESKRRKATGLKSQVQWQPGCKLKYPFSNLPKSFSERDDTLKTVMLVDDSLFMRTWLKRLISAEFTIITEAENGQDAILKYKIYKPDIVLMDITMPVINGLDALKAIVEFDPNSKVVMNSSMSQKFFIMESLRLGAKDFVIKPHFNNLIPILHNLCEEKVSV